MTFGVVDEKGIRDIHEAAIAMLDGIGMDIAGEEARRTLLDVGAKEKDGRIAFPGAVIEKVLSQTPKNGFEMFGRDGGAQFRLAPGACRVRPAGGLPFVYDVETKRRRTATMDDAAKIVKVVDALDQIDVVNCAASPMEVGVGIHNVRRFASALAGSTKSTDITASGPDEVAAVAELALLVRGTQEALEEKPLVVVYVSPTSPLRLSEKEGLAVMACAKRGLPLAPLSCPTLGVTAPVTIAGCVAQEWAEDLALMVLAYAVRPGLPIVACNRIFPADMRRGNSVAFGAPTAVAAAAYTQVAAHFGLPANSWGFASSSHLPDVQAGAERMLGTLYAALSGTAVISGAGALSSALLTSTEQLVIDNEIVRIVREAIAGVEVSERTLASDVIAQGVREGTFLATEHTLEQLQSGKITMPDLFMSEPYDTWAASGDELADRAHDRVEEILSDHETPALSQETVAEMEKILSAAGA